MANSRTNGPCRTCGDDLCTSAHELCASFLDCRRVSHLRRSFNPANSTSTVCEPETKGLSGLRCGVRLALL
jgi:hypothetical protein